MSAHCACWPHRRLRGPRHLAPRLARAHDQLVAERIARVENRRRLTGELLHAERLLAHRDLQHVRALATGKSRYISQRRRKLDWSRELVERLRGQLEAA